MIFDMKVTDTHCHKGYLQEHMLLNTYSLNMSFRTVDHVVKA